ncbi:hypothetical protein [Silvimonas soli]|uniref:hypothetical protein n=1 Tax=Silvimonas soli TaxID=2980100 RepID=UPI0024B38F9A|nr:hypothetical protein [Silvimonas soli]
MTIRQAGTPVTDTELAAAAEENIHVRTNREEGWRQTVTNKADKFKCRLFSVPLLLALSAGLLSGCGSTFYDHPPTGSQVADNGPAPDGPSLMMVPINHYERYAVDILVGKNWAGDANEPHEDGRPSGGGGAACCYAGYKDWTKPVRVRWKWGSEVDPQTKAVTKEREPHDIWVKLPGPIHDDPDPSKDEAYLCVILRDRDTVELAYSPVGSGCANK